MGTAVREYLDRYGPATSDPVQAYLARYRGPGLDVQPVTAPPGPIPQAPIEFATRPTVPDMTATQRVTTPVARATPADQPLTVARASRDVTTTREPRELFAGEAAFMNLDRRQQQAEEGAARRRKNLQETAHGLAEIGLRLYPGVNTLFSVAEGDIPGTILNAAIEGPIVAGLARRVGREAATGLTDDVARGLADQPLTAPVGRAEQIRQTLDATAPAVVPRTVSPIRRPTVAEKFVEEMTPAEREVNAAAAHALRVTDSRRNVGANVLDFEPEVAAVNARVAEAERGVLGNERGALGESGRIGPLYHGSPYKFDKFSTEKIGTGEGAAAYGHGLYFAENPAVARDYQQRLAGQARQLTPEASDALKAMDNLGFDTRGQAAGAILQHDDWATRWDIDPAHVPTLTAWREQALTNARGGALYHTELPNVSPDDLLDWDKPLSQQSAKVRAALEKMYAPEPLRGILNDALQGIESGNTTGETVYRILGGDAYATKLLNDAGLRGIRYLDQGSRGAKNIVVSLVRKSDGQLVMEKVFATHPEAESYAAEMQAKGMAAAIRNDATHNYVVFNADDINILNREGKGALKYLTGLTGAGAGAAGGAATINEDDSPAERAAKIAAGTALGAVAGGAAGVGLERLGTKGAAPIRAAAEAVDATPSALRLVPEDAPALTQTLKQGPLRKPEANTVARLVLPEDLSERVASIAREFEGPGHESFGQVKARAEQLLKTQNVPIDFTRGNRAEVLGAAALLKKNTEEAGQIARRLANPALTDVERTAGAQQLATLESQSRTLFNSITSAKTNQARDLAANRILANLSDVPEHWQYKAQQTAQRLLTDEEAAAIRGFLADGQRAAMLRYIAQLKPSTLTEKLTTAWKSILLTNPSTHATNIASNTVFQLTEEVARTPAAFFDWAITKISGGARTKTPTNAAILKASGRGAVKGLAEATKRIRGLPTGEELAAGTIPRITNMGHPLLTRLFHAPFAALDAADRPFFEAAVQGSLAEQATLLAQAEKLSGKALKARVSQLLALPTDEMVGRSLHDAAVRTFKTLSGSTKRDVDYTALGQVLSAVSNKGGVVGQVVVPFSMTPGAVATRFAESTPYGFVKGGLLWRQAIREAVDGLPNPALKQQAAETFGRATVGLAPIALGAFLYEQGKASGQTDVGDKTARATRRMLGVPDDAFQIGGNWVEFNRLGPQGMLMSLGAVMAQQFEQEDGGIGERVGQAAFAAGRTVTDQPFLQGVENLQRARESTEGASQYLAKLGASAVPAGVAAVARATDPTMREARTFSEQVQARIPWWSQELPAQRTAFGDERARMAPGAQNVFSPVRVTPIPTEISDQLLAEVARTGAQISQPSRQPGESGEAYSARLAQVGQAVRRNVLVTVASQRYRTPPGPRALAKHPEWARLSAAEVQRAYQAELIENAVREERGSQTRRATRAARRAP